MVNTLLPWFSLWTDLQSIDTPDTVKDTRWQNREEEMMSVASETDMKMSEPIPTDSWPMMSLASEQDLEWNLMTPIDPVAWDPNQTMPVWFEDSLNRVRQNFSGIPQMQTLDMNTPFGFDRFSLQWQMFWQQARTAMETWTPEQAERWRILWEFVLNPELEQAKTTLMEATGMPEYQAKQEIMTRVDENRNKAVAALMEQTWMGEEEAKKIVMDKVSEWRKALREQEKVEVKEEKPKNLRERYQRSLSKREEKQDEIRVADQTLAETVAQTLGNVIWMWWDFLLDTISESVKGYWKALQATWLDEYTTEPVKQELIELAQTDLWKRMLWSLVWWVEKIQQAAEENPRLFRNIEAAIDLADFVPIWKTVEIWWKAIKGTSKFAKNTINKAILSNIPDTWVDIAKRGSDSYSLLNDVYDNIVNKVTWLSKGTREMAQETPDVLRKAMNWEINAESQLDEVIDAIKRKTDDVAELSDQYRAIRESWQTIDTTSITSDIWWVLDNYKLAEVDWKINPTEIGQFNQSQINRMQEAFDIINQVKDKESISAWEILNIRQSLDDVADWREITREWTLDKKASAFIRSLRQSIDNIAKQNIDWLTEADKQVWPALDLLNKIKREILKPDGSIKDNAITRIGNLTSDANKQRLALISEFVPDIEDNIKVIRAAKEIENAMWNMVWRYTQSLVAGWALWAMTWWPLWVVTWALWLLASSPRAVVSILEKYGKFIKWIDNVIAKIKSWPDAIKSLTTSEIWKVVEAYSKAAIETMWKTPTWVVTRGVEEVLPDENR